MSDARTPIVGKAPVFTASGVMDGYLTASIQSIKASHKFPIVEVKDSAGFDNSLYAPNEIIELDVEVKLTAATVAAANGSAVFLRPLAQLTFTNADLPWINSTGVAGAYTGAWVYVDGSTIDLSNAAPGGAAIKLRKYANAAQNTLLTTTVQ